MTHQPPSQRRNPEIRGDDPEPFTIAIGIFGAVVGGVGYIERRLDKRSAKKEKKQEFRAAWRNAEGAVERLERQVGRFEEFIAEQGLSGEPLRYGDHRVVLDPDYKDQVRSLHQQALHTGSFLVKYMDEISNFLDVEYDDVLGRGRLALEALETPPQTYDELLNVMRTTLFSYTELLNEIRDREGFE